ncbi:MAG: Rhs element Vgr protein [Proteobacteria bacterium]|nr:Rhs element Vgr protein [Pseudomonadota bacterium]
MCYLPLIPQTVAWHDPGQYAWQNTAHGERMLGNQRQAIDACMKQFHGAGTVRSVAPGTTFTLAEHPEHDSDDAEQRNFLFTAAILGTQNDSADDFTVNRKKSPKLKCSWAPFPVFRVPPKISPRADCDCLLLRRECLSLPHGPLPAR